MLQDLRFGLRTLTRARGFSIAAVFTLATGIAGATTVYAIVDALLLRPLPFGERSSRLVTLHSTHPTQATDWDDSLLSYPDLVDIRGASRTLVAVEGLILRNFSLATDRESERVAGASITPGLFAMLGIQPQLGRDFRLDEAAAPGQETVALISHGVWQRLFGGMESVVGQPLPVNGRTVTVIGVMPRGFAFPERHDVWLPYRASPTEGRDRRNLLTFGLLAEGQHVRDARLELAGVAASLASTHPETNRSWGVHALALRDLFVRDSTQRGLAAMLVAVGLVLLVACANVASLLLARGIGRGRELAVRAALGACRVRLVRLMLAETLLLTLISGGLALLLAAWALDVLIRTAAEPMPYWAQIRIDVRVLAFAAASSLLAATATGLVPALRMSRVDAAREHLHGQRTGSTPGQRRLQGALVAGQVAFSLALLIGASLLARSTLALQHADIGFDAAPLMSARLYIAGDAYDDPVARAAMLERLLDRLRGLPGARSAAATGAIPGDDGGSGIRLVPERGGTSPDEQIGAQLVPVTAEFFATLDLPLIEGRTFSSDESRQPDANVTLVNRRLAERFWPGESALERRVRIVAPDGVDSYRVIGVAPDLVYEELGEESDQSRLIVYVPYARAGWRTMALLVRGDGQPASLAGPLRAAVREIDPFFAPYDMLTMADRRAVTMWGERFIGRTFAAFAVTALLLACIGIYGLTAYTAAERRHELGIRLAIGAQRGDIVRLLVRRGATLAAIGCAIGLPLAFGASQALSGLLFRVTPADAVTWTAAPLALVVAVLVSSFVPARRASRLDPLRALQE